MSGNRNAYHAEGSSQATGLTAERISLTDNDEKYKDKRSSAGSSGNKSRDLKRSASGTASKRPSATATSAESSSASCTPGNDDEATKLLKAGDACVALRDKEWFFATVIEKRNKETEGKNDQRVTRRSGEKEYYVHYEGYDRRLDEWVSMDRIRATAFRSWKNELQPERKRMTRSQKRKENEINHIQDTSGMDPTTIKLEEEHEKRTMIKYIDKIQFGFYEIDTWYFAPYPENYQVRKLCICQYCLKYTNSLATYKNHWDTCKERVPPGKEIYRKGCLSVFEVDGLAEKLYCQNLSLLSKLFLDHKTVYFHPDTFLFYVLCEVDQEGANLVGYFSKEKESVLNNTVSCILTMPHHQKKGYGKFLIAFSYELSKIEKVIGSPEKPLSDLGKLSFRSYWTYVLLNFLKTELDNEPISIKQLSKLTWIAEADVIYTLQTLNMTKFWKGQHVISVTGRAVQDFIDEGNLKPPTLEVDLQYLRWAPWPKSKAKDTKKSKKGGW